MRFNPADGSDVTGYETWYCPDYQSGNCYASDERYGYWAHGPDEWGDQTRVFAYLYGRRILVRNADGSQPVVVRAVDRGPLNTVGDQGQPYWTRPIDLSPWAMGALTGKKECLDWDGTDPLKGACQMDESAQVTVCWADNSLPLGPVTDPRQAKCAFEVQRTR